MSGPPAGAGAPSPEQIQAFKEAGVRTTFVSDIGMGFEPFILGSVILHCFLEATDQADTSRTSLYLGYYSPKYGIGIPGQTRRGGSYEFWW
jgi:hypothetical protein